MQRHAILLDTKKKPIRTSNRRALIERKTTHKDGNKDEQTKSEKNRRMTRSQNMEKYVRTYHDVANKPKRI